MGLDTSRLFRYQAPMMPERATFQQYVVGDMIDGELWLLDSAFPPQIAPVLDSDARFRVFVEGERHDMSALVAIWRHSSKHHAKMLKIYTLRELGIEAL